MHHQLASLVAQVKTSLEAAAGGDFKETPCDTGSNFACGSRTADGTRGDCCKSFSGTWGDFGYTIFSTSDGTGSDSTSLLVYR